MEKPNFKKMCLMYIQQLTNFPYIEKDFDALTDYQLLCKVVSYLNKIIVNENTQNDIITALYNAFIELKDYVDTYFDNLDVQEEINTKLDEMAEDGTLEQIIEQYLNSSAIWGFDNVALMKNATNLINGSYAKTLGYYNKNDGGSSLYKIRTITNDDIVDDATIIPLNNENLIAELIVNNNINVKQFGAYSDGEHDDSLYIEKAINYINNSNKKQTLYFPFGEYKISQSFYCTSNVSIEGNNSKIVPVTGTYIKNFIFLLNTQNGISWVTEWEGKATYKNLQFINKNSVENIKAFCLAQNQTTFENINLTNFYGFVQDAENSYYLDQIRFVKCTCGYNRGSEYMILKRGNGDGLLIEQCHFASSSDSFNQNAIQLIGCGGGEITDNINGNIYLSNCHNMSINNGHFERGSITLKDSRVSINNTSLWKMPNKTPITIIDSELENNYGEYNVPISTTLNMVEFILRYEDYTYKTNNYDIDISKCKQNIYINNCFRFAQSIGTGNSKRSYTGISILTSSGAVINQYDTCYFKNNILLSNQSSIFNASLGTNSPSNSLFLDESDDVPATLNKSTYYYRMVTLMNVSKKIRGVISTEKSIAKTNGEKSTVLNIPVGHQENIITRIYRGTSAGVYDKYVDIPNIKNYHLYDDGSSINGFLFNDRTAGDIDSFEQYAYSYCKYINPISQTVETNYFNKPTTGTWNVGDVVINRNPNGGTAYGWICTEAGTPGTWKAFGTIES